MPFAWPDPPMQIVLVEPRIPPNTGNVARLCAATGSLLHLVEPLGFTITDAALRRAGLDYWDAVEIITHPSLDAFLASLPGPDRLHLVSTRAERSYLDAQYHPGDYLVLGSETEGLPQDLLDQFPAAAVNVPVRLDHVRSLNLATCAGVVLYEALRQAEAQSKKN